MGTPWVTQRGFDETQMVTLADFISDLLKACTPYFQETGKNASRRAKVDFSVLEESKLQVRDLAQKAGIDFEPSRYDYPHFYYLDAKPGGKSVVFEMSGERIRSFMNYAFSSDVEILKRGESQATRLYSPRGQLDGILSCVDPNRFRISFPAEYSSIAAAWLRDLSDGYVMFDDDPLRKLPGPVLVTKSNAKVQPFPDGEPLSKDKPYFSGTPKCTGEPLPRFEWVEAEPSLHRTPLFETHKQLGAKLIPFAGWEMPVWYTSVMEEHLAVRQAAGIFDVTHMGVYQVEGPDAAVFLDSLVGNDIGLLDVGQSCYTHLLDPDANVIDDLLVYRRNQEIFLVVVNASNDDKNWAWINAVKNGKILVSNSRTGARAFGRDAVLRNLRDPRAGKDMRLDIALQGPRSRDILLALGVDEATRQKIMLLKRTELCDAAVGGFDLVVSRTGYTGEKMAFELFVHPKEAANLFTSLLKIGEPFGIKPIGLAARDSLRTEAGLPLYGHEMGLGSGHRGHVDLRVADAGFGSYVKTYKPWFIGRDSYLEHSKSRQGEVVRFRFNEKGIRMAHNSDPAVDLRGRVIGWVTSCAVDSEGFLTGQAYLDLKNAEEGSQIFIFQSASDKAGKVPAEFVVGDRATIPTPATVISRFPK
jgi:glycine hydroxymethyltransferase